MAEEGKDPPWSCNHTLGLAVCTEVHHCTCHSFHASAAWQDGFGVEEFSADLDQEACSTTPEFAAVTQPFLADDSQDLGTENLQASCPLIEEVAEAGVALVLVLHTLNHAYCPLDQELIHWVQRGHEAFLDRRGYYHVGHLACFHMACWLPYNCYN